MSDLKFVQNYFKDVKGKLSVKLFRDRELKKGPCVFMYLYRLTVFCEMKQTVVLGAPGHL